MLCGYNARILLVAFTQYSYYLTSIQELGNARSFSQQSTGATTVLSRTHGVEGERKVDNPIYGEPETVIINGVYSVIPFDPHDHPPLLNGECIAKKVGNFVYSS